MFAQYRVQKLDLARRLASVDESHERAVLRPVGRDRPGVHRLLPFHWPTPQRRKFCRRTFAREYVRYSKGCAKLLRRRAEQVR